MPVLAPLPERSTIGWRRLDGTGEERCTIVRSVPGWRLNGVVTADESGVAARLSYVIECDPKWRTRSATVDGVANDEPFKLELTADGAGRWWSGGVEQQNLRGAIDIDLGFTPATNLIPIRRLSLAIGDCAEVRAVWLRFPELRLELLEQKYCREAEHRFRYYASVDRESYIAALETDPAGIVTCYEGLWVGTSR